MNRYKYYRIRKITERGYNPSFYVEACNSIIGMFFGRWHKDKKSFPTIQMALSHINQLKRMSIIENVIVYTE